MKVFCGDVREFDANIARVPLPHLERFRSYAMMQVPRNQLPVLWSLKETTFFRKIDKSVKNKKKKANGNLTFVCMEGTFMVKGNVNVVDIVKGPKSFIFFDASFRDRIVRALPKHEVNSIGSYFVCSPRPVLVERGVLKKVRDDSHLSLRLSHESLGRAALSLEQYVSIQLPKCVLPSKCFFCYYGNMIMKHVAVNSSLFTLVLHSRYETKGMYDATEFSKPVYRLNEAHNARVTVFSVKRVVMPD